MKSQNAISQAVRLALFSGAAVSVAATSAYAADAGSSSTAKLGKIEVTGSRIKRTDIETAQPVTVVTKQQIQATGLVSIGDILQSLTSAGSALNTQFNNGGNGETRVDLRNLGSRRVLVLVNGRRWTAGLSGAVDLNTIPASIIDHIEVLQDGASAIYGSDAIAGVINIITVKNYNGAEASAYMGMYNGDGHWDGKQQEYDFTVGTSNDRSSALLNVGYVNLREVWAGQRDISAPVQFGAIGGGSSATPAGRFLLVTAPGATLNCGPTATVSTFGGGYSTCDVTLKAFPNNTPTLSNFRDWVGSGVNDDHYNFAPANYLLTPSERWHLYTQAHYDIADNLTFSTEILYNHRGSQQALAPSPLFFFPGGISANGVSIGVAGNNPFNPFGFDLVANYSDACIAAGTCAVIGLIGRRPIEAKNRFFTQSVDTYQFNSGFNGYFTLMGNEWDWDVNYNYGNTAENDITNGLFNTQRLQTALGDVNVCNATPGCVPFNLFGGNGSITQPMLNYVLFEAHDATRVTTRDYTGNISGTLFDGWAGPWGLAFGYEYLSVAGFSHPDALISAGNTSGNITQPTDGKENTSAQYIELNIPLASDVFMAKELTLDLANRWSQFDWRGGTPGTPASTVKNFAHASTGRAALKWKPIDDLLIRASWSEGFRLPAVSELFFGNSDNFPNAADPCSPAPFGSWDGILADLPAGCPVGGGLQPNGQIKSTVGGNPGLSPERSTSQSIGFVYNPSWFEGFDFSADFYKINLVNAVARLGAQTILNGCYIAGVAAECAKITRPGKQVTTILDTNVNVGGDFTEGWDIATHYKFPSTVAGDFKIGVDITLLKVFNRTVPDATQPTLVRVDQRAGREFGTFGFPRQRVNASLDWTLGNWSAVYNLYYYGRMKEDCLASGLCAGPGGNGLPTTNPIFGPDNTEGGTTYSDIQGSYHLDAWNTDFTLGIRNLFDKSPPVITSAFANSFDPTYYRTPGRFYYGRVSVRF